MNNHFLAHIIRDVFINTQFTIYYGKDIDFINTLRNSEHGIGAYHLHSEQCSYELSNSLFWNVGVDDLYFSENSCDLFISSNYNPLVKEKLYALNSIYRCMKPGGIILLYNYGEMFSDMPEIFKYREDLRKEIKRYTMFKNKKVDIYESI